MAEKKIKSGVPITIHNGQNNYGNSPGNQPEADVNRRQNILNTNDLSLARNNKSKYADLTSIETVKTAAQKAENVVAQGEASTGIQETRKTINDQVAVPVSVLRVLHAYVNDHHIQEDYDKISDQIKKDATQIKTKYGVDIDKLSPNDARKLRAGNLKGVKVINHLNANERNTIANSIEINYNLKHGQLKNRLKMKSGGASLKHQLVNRTFEGSDALKGYSQAMTAFKMQQAQALFVVNAPALAGKTAVKGAQFAHDKVLAVKMKKAGTDAKALKAVEDKVRRTAVKRGKAKAVVDKLDPVLKRYNQVVKHPVKGTVKIVGKDAWRLATKVAPGTTGKLVNFRNTLRKPTQKIHALKKALGDRFNASPFGKLKKMIRGVLGKVLGPTKWVIAVFCIICVIATGSMSGSGLAQATENQSLVAAESADASTTGGKGSPKVQNMINKVADNASSLITYVTDDSKNAYDITYKDLKGCATVDGKEDKSVTLESMQSLKGSTNLKTYDVTGTIIHPEKDINYLVPIDTSQAENKLDSEYNDAVKNAHLSDKESKALNALNAEQDAQVQAFASAHPNCNDYLIKAGCTTNDSYIKAIYGLKDNTTTVTGVNTTSGSNKNYSVKLGNIYKRWVGQMDGVNYDKKISGLRDAYNKVKTTKIKRQTLQTVSNLGDYLTTSNGSPIIWENNTAYQFNTDGMPDKTTGTISTVTANTVVYSFSDGSPALTVSLQDNIGTSRGAYTTTDASSFTFTVGNVDAEYTSDVHHATAIGHAIKYTCDGAHQTVKAQPSVTGCDVNGEYVTAHNGDSLVDKGALIANPNSNVWYQYFGPTTETTYKDGNGKDVPYCYKNFIITAFGLADMAMGRDDSSGFNSKWDDYANDLMKYQLKGGQYNITINYTNTNNDIKWKDAYGNVVNTSNQKAQDTYAQCEIILHVDPGSIMANDEHSDKWFVQNNINNDEHDPTSEYYKAFDRWRQTKQVTQEDGTKQEVTYEPSDEKNGYRQELELMVDNIDQWDDYTFTDPNGCNVCIDDLGNWASVGDGTYKGLSGSAARAKFVADIFPAMQLKCVAMGFTNPRACIAQLCLESGSGQHESGKYNYYGIKASDAEVAAGKATLCNTHELVNGVSVATQAYFLNYNSIDESINDYLDSLNRKWPGTKIAKTPAEFVQALVADPHKKYMTADPAQYAQTMSSVMGSIPN